MFAAALTFIAPVISQSKSDLTITAEDIYIEAGDENGPSKNGSGYHLYIRKKSGMESVMLIESDKDPSGKQTNYAYRATSYNKINGDEIRYLNGKVLESETAKYSLIDSTPEKNDKLGLCFHIYIPEVIVFGYPWARSGEIHIADGVYLNIRTFEKKYADYTGAFLDNSFNVRKRVSSKKSKTETTEPVKTIPDSLKTEVTENNSKKEVVATVTKSESLEINKQLAQNDKSAGNFAEKFEAYNSSYITDDEPELESIAAIPFEEELPDSFYDSYDEEEQESESEEIAEAASEEIESEEAKAEEKTDAIADNKMIEKNQVEEAPALTPFEEEDLYEEPEPVQEFIPEVEEEPEEIEPEIPEDEREPPAETPYDEVATNYDPDKLERTKKEFDEWLEKTLKSADPDQPFEESMDGVDPDFIAKLELEEAARLALEKWSEKTQEEEKIPLGNRFITHGIEMLKVDGNKKIQGLYISKTEVTQASYRMVTGVNPSTNQGDYYPVETVSWYDVLVFCNLLSIRDGLVPCYSINGARNPGAWGSVPKDSRYLWNAVQCDFDADGYRMLTIEEWEYAAMGGPSRQRGKYAGSNYIDDVAWYKNNSDESTHFVAQKMPNACGLYDMCGNVSEWCWGETDSEERNAAVRGGNYSYDKKYSKSNFKDSCQAWYAHYENGIRICRSLEYVPQESTESATAGDDIEEVVYSDE